MRALAPLLPTLLLPLLSAAVSAGTPSPLRLASWNLEWLVSTATTQAARRDCLAGRHAALPCDTALDAGRSSADYASLARYARELDADVIAVQEVEDAATAARVFPGYAFCLSTRNLTQKPGFAIRAGLRFRCGADYEALALDGHGRPGVQLVVDPGGPRELHLLAVHLKSGCATAALETPTIACRQVARQLPAVGAWMQSQRQAGHRHVVLGDFNRSWDVDSGETLALLAGGQAGPLPFDVPEASTGFISCFPGQTFTRYIDHLLVGHGGGLIAEPSNFYRVRFKPADVRHYHLSDHCPVGVVLRFTAAPDWHTRSTVQPTASERPASSR